MSNISNLIETEKKQYEEKVLKTNPSFAERTKDILDLIDLYWVSKYRDSDTDSLGFKKTFYNIVNFPVETNSKMLDLDTKDIKLMAEDWASYWASWLMGKELKMWMKEMQFGKQLNKYALNFPKYGHLVVKKVDDDVELVPLQNLIFKPDAKDISNIPIIEKHSYSPNELKMEAKKRGWDKNIAEKASKSPDEDGNVIVYEVYCPQGFLEDEENNYFIITEDAEEEMFSAKKTECPYKELAWERLDGRCLGRGQVEKLFEEQIYLNRIGNYKAEGLHWTSKHFFQTKDTGIASNLLTSVENGEILIVNSELTPVAVEERNLHTYREEEQKWEENVTRRTFAREPITGGRAPAGTPLGSTIIQTKQASDYFEQKKEELGMFIKEILWDWILPEFKKQKRSEHKILMKNILEGDEGNSEKLHKLLLSHRMNKLTAERHLDPEQTKIVRGIQSEIIKNEEITIPKGFYDNLKYKIDIVITGEQIDLQSRMTTLQTIFQVLGSNPTILQDKRVKKIFYRMMDLSGINPEDLQLDEEPSLEETISAQRGGSIAAPKPAPAVASANVETKI